MLKVEMKSSHLWFYLSFFCIKYINVTSASAHYLDNDFHFLNQTVNDEILPTCSPNAVCSVIHKRFWSTPIVRTFCKCKGAEDCIQRWHHHPDSKTMQLDSRSQLKFCNHITDLPTCTVGKQAIKVQTKTNEETSKQEVSAVVNCNCQWPIHWTLQRHSYKNYSNGTSISNDAYTCASLKKCKTNEFCGNIRADTFSAYYQCSCPVGTLCLTKNRRIKDYASELLYEGHIYRATCRPFKLKSKG
ncbi:U-scoloptoxin(11)-Ssd2a-like [Lycorma delicatula]|uniref:U-scoloptoxin(11)-Ssd2a-like n=1 Tax=Lycorma delicatula TaxID=130591 RepID=UPI003F519990